MNEDLEQPIIEPRKEPVEPAVLHLALQRMRNAARGNGIDPDTIMLDGFDGYTVEYEAQSLFVIKPTVFEKSVPGRERGEVCISALDLRGKIREATENTTINTDIIDFATTYLGKRPDKGFMVENLGLKFERLNRTFLFYNSCTNCTAGKINCMACQGAGLINCPRCRGQRKISCPACHGAMYVRSPNGASQSCRQCSGRGEIPCDFCHSGGKVKCRPCVGSGQTPCPKCNATGIISDMAYVTFEGKTHFTYDRDILPPQMIPLLEKIGPAVALYKHADVRILKKKEQAIAQQTYETEEKAPVKDDLVVPFLVRLPWGTIRFRLEERILDGKLFGQHPRLLNLPAFLEKPIGPGLDRLTQAAHGLGNVDSNIDEAIRFRIIADAMVAASAMTKKKAVLYMRKRWSIGISGDVTDRMTLLAADAYQNISKFPRLMGLGVGFILTAGIDAAYIAGPLRHLLVIKGMPLPAMIPIDLLLVAGTGYIAESSSRLVAKHALWHLFKKLLPPDQLHKIKPHAGSISIYAYIGAVIIFAAIIIAALFTGHAIPEWIAALVSKKSR